MLQTGQKTVTTAGTRVALSTSIANGTILIKAKSTNTGLIYIGDSSVSSSNGYILSAGEIFFVDNAGRLGDIYLDASVDSQGVSWAIVDQV